MTTPPTGPHKVSIRPKKLNREQINALLADRYVGHPDDFKVGVVLLLDSIGVLHSAIGEILGVSTEEVNRLVKMATHPYSMFVHRALWRLTEIFRKHLVFDMRVRNDSLGLGDWVPDIFPLDYPEELLEGEGFIGTDVGLRDF